MLNLDVSQLITTNKITTVAEGLILFIVLFLIFKLIMTIFTRIVKEFTKRTKTDLDDYLLYISQKPLEYFALLLSANITLFVTIPDFTIGNYNLDILFKILWVILIGYSINTLSNAIIRWYADKIVDKAKTSFHEEILPILRRLTSIIVYSAVAVIIFNLLGIEVAPLLAGLGIVGLAVALALQESLVNFFAGVYLLADKPIRGGDYIKIEGMHEGYVDEIGWRSTKLRTLINTTIIVPNSKLSQSIITNFSLPTRRIGHEIKIYLAYDQDVEKVKSLLLATAQKTLEKTDGAAKEIKPAIATTNLEYDIVELTIGFQVERYVERVKVANALRNDILTELKRNRIKMPSRFLNFSKVSL